MKPVKPGLLLAALVLATAVVTIDNTVLNVALPQISEQLDASVGQLQWIVNAYSLLFGGLLLTAGTAADRLGRRRVLIGGLAAFALASGLVVLVHSGPQLVVLRALVGAAAAFVMPSTLAILVRSFSGPARANAVGLWGAVTAAGFAAGPVLGGALLHWFGWQSVFLVNVPIAAVAIVACARWVPESSERSAGRLDLPGTGLSVATMVALVDALVSGPVDGWASGSVLVPGMLAVLFGAAFVVRELTAASPMLDVRRLARPAFAGPAAAEAALMFSLAGSLFLITQQLQLVLGHSAFVAGLLVAPAALGVVLASPLVARFSDRITARTGAVAGLLTIALALGGMSLFLRHGYWPLGVGLFVLGLGMRLAMTPIALAVVDALPGEEAGMGSALNDTFQEIGGALGVAILGSVFNAGYRDALPAGVPEAVRSSLAGALQLGDGRIAALARDAFQSGMVTAGWVCAAVLAVTAVACVRAMPAKVLREEDEAAVPEPGAVPVA